MTNSTSLADVLAYKKRKSLFMSVKKLAEFQPISQTICLNEINGEDLLRNYANGNHFLIRDHLMVLMHEITHWADFVGTLWGQTYLKKIYESMHVLEMKKKRVHDVEWHFWRWLDLKEVERRRDFPKYYYVLGKNPKNTTYKTPWEMKFTCGLEFDPFGKLDFKRPIFMVNFLDVSEVPQNQLVVRQPISIGSLLETLATWSEIKVAKEIFDRLSPDEQLVEKNALGEEFLENAYNPYLTEYSTPAHLLSFCIKTRDIYTSYRLASLVAYVALNLPHSMFSKIIHPREFDDYEIRKNAFIKNHDRGYIFAVICHHAAIWHPSYDDKNWIDNALSRSGLPNFDKIQKASLETMRSIRNLDVNGSYSDTYRYICEIGEEIFNTRNSQTDVGLSIDILSQGITLPEIFGCDIELFSFPAAAPIDKTRLDTSKIYDAGWELDQELSNFYTACR